MLAVAVMLWMAAPAFLGPVGSAHTSLRLAISAHAAQPAVPKSYAAAMRWYQAAAEAGDPKAQFYFGLILEQGVHGKADATAAAGWYRKSAQQGFALAELKMAQAMHFGIAVPVNLLAARAWYEKAAAAGLAEAQFNLAILLETGGPDIADPARAVTLYAQAAQAGLAEAAVNLANIYIQGGAADQDLAAGYMWLSIADGLGEKTALAMSRQLAPALDAKQRQHAAARAVTWLQNNQ